MDSSSGNSDDFDFLSPETDSYAFLRGKARLDQTTSALMRRGIDSELARSLRTDGFTLSALKQMDDGELSAVGLSPLHVKSLREGGRSAVPFQHLARVLWANRFTCCICRDPKLAIILHHIVPWAKSHDHAVTNLAVLCLEHHARAHRRGDLEQNLTPRNLVQAKTAWEAEVAALDPKAILDASRISGHHWWWFNHVRLLELAEQLNVDLRRSRVFADALSSGLVDDRGHLTDLNRTANYRYEGGGGTYLYRYVKGVLENVLSQTAIFNVSDDLDPGFLSQVVSAGDIILVQGKHYFKRLNNSLSGLGNQARCAERPMVCALAS